MSPVRKRLGRPPMPRDERRDSVVRIRVTKSELAKFTRLGGREWFRRVLARAR